mmetsp:Transcript_100/g.197  ORF Transcript_100/g.197 Transcript_100/m.197 type:complete len:304 (-) Transcript_100:245-1156(-)
MQTDVKAGAVVLGQRSMGGTARSTVHSRGCSPIDRRAHGLKGFSHCMCHLINICTAPHPARQSVDNHQPYLIVDVPLGTVTYQFHYIILCFSGIVFVRSRGKRYFQLVKLRHVPRGHLVHRRLQYGSVHLQLLLPFQQNRKGFHRRGKLRRVSPDSTSCGQIIVFSSTSRFGADLLFFGSNVLQLGSVALDRLRERVELMLAVERIDVRVNVKFLPYHGGRPPPSSVVGIVRIFWLDVEFHPIGLVLQNVVDQCLVGGGVLHGSDEIHVPIHDDEDGTMMGLVVTAVSVFGANEGGVLGDETV